MYGTRDKIIDSHVIYTNQRPYPGSFLVRKILIKNMEYYTDVVAEINGLFSEVPPANYSTWDSEIQGINGPYRLGRYCIWCHTESKKENYELVINYRLGETGYCCNYCIKNEITEDDLSQPKIGRIKTIMSTLLDCKYKPYLLYSDSDDYSSDSDTESEDDDESDSGSDSDSSSNGEDESDSDSDTESDEEDESDSDSSSSSDNEDESDSDSDDSDDEI